MYSLIRTRDGKGDYGPASASSGGGIRPLVGYTVTVGSLSHWWSTTKVEEILLDTEDHVRFRTVNNSVYDWKLIS